MPKKIKKKIKKSKSFKEIDKEEFKRAVWKQGFSLEHDVFKILQEKGWGILPNRRFQESPNESVREYDLLAYKDYAFGFEGKTFIFYIVLIIECKYNPFKIVFYIRPLKKSYPLTFFIGKDFQKIFSEKNVKEIFKKNRKYKSFFYLTEQVFGYQAFEYDKTAIDKQGGLSKNKRLYKPRPEWTEKRIFKAISSVAAATRFERAINKKEYEANERLCLFFPLVIFSGNLFRAFMKKRRLIKKHSIFSYKTGGKSLKQEGIIPEEYCIHIITKSEIKKTISIFERMFKEFVKEAYKLISQKEKKSL